MCKGLYRNIKENVFLIYSLSQGLGIAFKNLGITPKFLLLTAFQKEGFA